jgi:hypothetical protein
MVHPGQTWRIGGALVGVLALSACPPPECQNVVPLVDAEAWALVTDEAQDPFAPLVTGPVIDKAEPPPEPVDPEAPPLVRCGPEDVQQEFLGDEQSLQVTTQFCSLLTVQQPLLAPIAAGDVLQLRLWHFALTSYPRAEAVVGVALGDDVVFTVSEAVPSPDGVGALVAPQLTVDKAYSAGTLVSFHIGNHGGNTWNLIELSTTATGPCPTSTATP